MSAPSPSADAAGLIERLTKVNPWRDMDWPEVIREAAAVLSRLSAELELAVRVRDSLILAVEKSEAALAEAQRERDEWKARWQAKADAFEVQEQTIAILSSEAQRERDTLTGQQFAEYVERAETDLQHWKALAEKAEARIADLRASCDSLRETKDTFFRNAEAWETKCNAAWRERDGMQAKAEARIAEAREVLAAWDINSLPNDMPLLEVCEARIDDLRKFMDRAEKAEAALAESEKAHQDFRLQNDREWRTKVDHLKAQLAEEKAQVFAALQERDDLAVALAEAQQRIAELTAALERRGEAIFGREGD